MNWKLIGICTSMLGGALAIITAKANEEQTKEEIRKEISRQLSLNETEELD